MAGVESGVGAGAAGAAGAAGGALVAASAGPGAGGGFVCAQMVGKPIKQVKRSPQRTLFIFELFPPWNVL